MKEILLIIAWYRVEKCLKYPEIRPRYVPDLHDICLGYDLRYAWWLPEITLIFAGYLLVICLRYQRYILKPAYKNNVFGHFVWMSEYLQHRHWDDVLILGAAPDQEKIVHDWRSFCFKEYIIICMCISRHFLNFSDIWELLFGFKHLILPA